MLNFPAPRRQSDGQQDEYSDLTATNTDAWPDQTRQEFKQEADVNYILSRFGVGPTPQRQTIYTEVDYDLDLAAAMSSVETAERMYYKLPQELRSKYPTWQSVLNGVRDGTLRINLANHARKPDREADPIPDAPPA